MDNKTMMQYFEWNGPPDALLWRRAEGQAKALKANGIDMLWLPPAYKGAAGIRDVGYGVYDLYDLGEFDQKGTIPTKYGTRAEYLAAIKALQKAGVQVLVDIVLNHRIGADETEQVMAAEYDPENRNRRISGEEEIAAWTKYTFPGRKGKYSRFEWNWTCFSAIDWDEESKSGGIYRFDGKEWSPDVDSEKGNFDYLMGANVDMSVPWVVEELNRWGKWYLDTTRADGLRLDALKHIDYSFYEQWLDNMQESCGEDLLVVGEYWSGDLKDLQDYLTNCGGRVHLFDVPLHMAFRDASRSGGNYDMGSLLNNSLARADGAHAVTFVDNHDSQPGQALESWVEPWFKPIAYAVILLRQEGVPCVFYADYYGLRAEGTPPVASLKRMLQVRKRYAYGEQHDYFDTQNVVGWTREGDAGHPNSGCAVLATDGPGGDKTMYVGKQHAGELWRDVIGRMPPATVAADGTAKFYVAGGGVDIWVNQAAYAEIVTECE